MAGMPFQVSIRVAAITADEAADAEQVEIVRRRLSMRQEKGEGSQIPALL